MNIPVKDNKKLEKVQELVNKDKELHAVWEACNTMAVRRLGMSDHGQVHVTIVANIALKILRNLVKAGVTPNIKKDYSFEEEDAEIVVVLASLLHDLGNSVHRDLHDELGVVLAKDFLEKILGEVYEDKRQKQIVLTETLNAMVSHSEEIQVFTVEAGVVRLADALDMEKGRARISFEQGRKDIYNVSAMSIEKVKITSGDRPVMIEIKMNNPAGIFQVDHLLKKKLAGTGLEKYVEVKAIVEQREENIINEYKL